MCLKIEPPPKKEVEENGKTIERGRRKERKSAGNSDDKRFTVYTLFVTYQQ